MTITMTSRRGSSRAGVRPKALGNCVRCFDPTPATTTERVTYGGDEYEVLVCQKHAELFQRDMLTWVRLGTLVEEDDSATFRMRQRSDDDSARRGTVIAAHIAVPVVRQAEQLPAEDPVRRERVEVLSGRPPSIAEQAARQVVGSLPAGFEKWTFSDHALERQEARGVSRAEALWCAAEPDVVTPGSRINTLIHRRGHVETVVNPTWHRIVTVINRTIEKNQEKAANAS